MSKHITFFIVDDDIDDQEIFMAAVNEVDESIHCITASDCEEALQLLKHEMTELPDYIFLDLNMPRIDGRQCLTELKKESKLRSIPVIIYSTSSLKKDIEETASLGAAHFLVKPNKFDELCSALSDIIRTDWKQKRA